MRTPILVLALATTILPTAAYSQATRDMTRVTCANYLAMSPSEGRFFSAWMSGWFNQKYGYITVGLDDFAKNVASIRQWCTNKPDATIMSALEGNRPQQGPPTGQVKVDMSLITCKQYLTSDAERQIMIANWMSGYFRASRNQPIFDYQRFADNIASVGNYCRKHGDETVMSAIQKKAK